MVRATTDIPAPTTPYVHIGRWDLLRFSVDDVEVLLRTGVVSEDLSIELLNGLLVRKDRAATGGDPSMIGPGQRVCVERLSDLRGRINAASRHVASQQPIRCGIDELPEPDFAVIRGSLSDYADRYPVADDIHCVIEVADSSYERDVGEKLAVYARAGVGQYVVINLRNRTAEVYQTPDRQAGTYAPPSIVPADGVLELDVGDPQPLAVNLAELLP